MYVDFNQMPEWLDKPVAECVSIASKEFSVPPVAILLVLAAEGGRLGSVRQNKNGTIDMGPMQINSLHTGLFSKYGITNEMITNDLCINIRAGTWKIKSEMNRNKGDLWKGVASYHSRTPLFNNIYMIKLKNILYRWVKDGHIHTIEVKE